MKPLGAVVPQLAKLIPLLASNHDGEVVATARAIERVLRNAGHDWHDLADVIVAQSAPPLPPPPDDDWRGLAKYCADRAPLLNDRDLDFVVTLARYDRNPSPRQMDWLFGIVVRLQVRDPAYAGRST